MNQRELFFQHLAQTSPSPLAIEIVKAEGLLLNDAAGNKYLDMIGGISVCNTGHRHPAVVQAIKNQADHYLHVLVYGEFIQSPQVDYATLLAALLPPSLDSVYFTNSGAEAAEGAMKLAKRVTGRTQMIAFKNSYHGSTQGALSIIGDEYWRNAYRPLLPDVEHLEFNSMTSLGRISNRTACVIAETVQAESGVCIPSHQWLTALRERCNKHQVMLIFDEVQAGFGRTGSLWAFQQFDVAPDILMLGKALGGGMPLGAFIAGRHLMSALTENPVLGHITTFGGHPVCCAAGKASLEVLLTEKLVEQVKPKAALFLSLLKHHSIKAVRSAGLLIAVEFESFEFNKQVIDLCIRKGVITDWFLFAPNCMRLAPPLIIREEEIRKACRVILEAVEEAA